MTKCYGCTIENCINPMDKKGGIKESICPDGYFGKVICKFSKECEYRKSCIHGTPHDPYTICEKWEVYNGDCKNQGGICNGNHFVCVDFLELCKK